MQLSFRHHFNNLGGPTAKRVGFRPAIRKAVEVWLIISSAKLCSCKKRRDVPESHRPHPAPPMTSVLCESLESPSHRSTKQAIEIGLHQHSRRPPRLFARPFFSGLAPRTRKKVSPLRRAAVAGRHLLTWLRHDRIHHRRPSEPSPHIRAVLKASTPICGFTRRWQGSSKQSGSPSHGTRQAFRECSDTTTFLHFHNLQRCGPVKNGNFITTATVRLARLARTLQCAKARVLAAPYTLTREIVGFAGSTFVGLDLGLPLWFLNITDQELHRRKCQDICMTRVIAPQLPKFSSSLQQQMTLLHYVCHKSHDVQGMHCDKLLIVIVSGVPSPLCIAACV